MFPAGETGGRAPASDLLRLVLNRMVGELRASAAQDTAAVSARVDAVLRHYWWLISHRDTIAAIAERAGVDAYVAAEVVSAAHRLVTSATATAAQELQRAEVETERFARVEISDASPSAD